MLKSLKLALGVTTCLCCIDSVQARSSFINEDYKGRVGFVARFAPKENTKASIPFNRRLRMQKLHQLRFANLGEIRSLIAVSHFSLRRARFNAIRTFNRRNALAFGRQLPAAKRTPQRAIQRAHIQRVPVQKAQIQRVPLQKAPIRAIVAMNEKPMLEQEVKVVLNHAPLPVQQTTAEIHMPVVTAPAPVIDLLEARWATESNVLLVPSTEVDKSSPKHQTGGFAAVETDTKAEEPAAIAPSLVNAVLIDIVKTGMDETRSLLNKFNADSRIVVKGNPNEVKVGLWNIKKYIENTKTDIKGGIYAVIFMALEDLVTNTKAAIKAPDIHINDDYAGLVSVKHSLKTVLENLTFEQGPQGAAAEAMTTNAHLPVAVKQEEVLAQPQRPILERAHEVFGKLNRFLQDSHFGDNGLLVSIIGQLKHVGKLGDVKADDEVATLRLMIENLAEVNELNHSETMSLSLALVHASQLFVNVQPVADEEQMGSGSVPSAFPLIHSSQLVVNAEPGADKEQKDSGSAPIEFDLKGHLNKIISEMPKVKENSTLNTSLKILHDRLKELTGSEADTFEESINKVNNINIVDNKRSLDTINFIAGFIVKGLEKNMSNIK